MGTEGPDVIYGTSGADRIAGLGGDDLIFGLGGADQIFVTDESKRDDYLIRPPQTSEDIVRVRPVKYRLLYADELAL